MKHHFARTPRLGSPPAIAGGILPPGPKPFSCISWLKLPASTFPLSVLCVLLSPYPAPANPTGGIVSQGKASFNTSGSQLTINTSANTFINWSSFNIGAGETTTFVQPSASSVVWNQINGGSPSQILGNLNANGYVILQNQSGFYVGGSAAINTHGLIMTTAPTPAPNLSGGGAWSFNAPPPSAQIINYGQINITGGGSAFLIANDIVNHGTISAPGGNIGLYAGEQVLVSTTPDGRGFSTQVTLPQGSVDNEGRLIADGGAIMARAQTVNQNGLVEANSVQNVNGVIELVASDNLTLGANSDIEAHGDNSAANPGASPGGSVTIKSGNTFSDQAGSTINISGGARGGNGGQVEISASAMEAIQSRVNGRAEPGFTEGQLTIDPTDLTLDANFAASLASQTASITLQADNDIEISALLTLSDLNASATFSLIAGNNITLDDGAGIAAGNDWNVSLTAGKAIYLNGTSSIQTQNGNLALLAPALYTLKGADITISSLSGNVELGSTWTLDDAAAPGALSLYAGNNLTLDPGAGIAAGNNWDVTLTAGTVLFNGNASIQTLSGDITLLTSALQTQSGGNLNITAPGGNIELSSLFTLNDATTPSSLNFTAGNSIIVDDGAGISAGNDWSVNLVAGTGFAPTAAQPTPAPGSGGDGIYNYGIYLNGSAYVQTDNGNINLWAANEVQLATSGSDVAGSTGIRTLNGGNVTVTTQYGDVNTGANPMGYAYQDSDTPPYYTVATGIGTTLGGISTVAGGNVTITAGGNIYSYLPAGSSSVSQSADDGGSGAFGPEPGNVTITAGGSIFGHYVLADGVGTITAGQNVGANSGHPFALSLVDGGWRVNAPNGNIYLQEVRNPNGVFNNLDSSAAGNHLFDYDPQASVDLTAVGVYLTSQNVPRPDGNVPVLYPPILDITAGAGGVTLEGNVTLFPSAYQSLDITTTDGGNFVAELNGQASTLDLYMSDSSQRQWAVPGIRGTFSIYDHGDITADLNDPNPVVINLSGDMENLDLITSQATQIKVGGDMINCGFSGQNLHASDVTSIEVAGQIYNRSSYSFVTLSQAPGVIQTPGVTILPPGMASSWDNIFTLALDPNKIAGYAAPMGSTPGQWLGDILLNASLFGVSQVQATGQYVGDNPGFVYNQATGQLGFGGPMQPSTLSYLSAPLTVLVFGPTGAPLTYTKTVNGVTGTYFQTTQVTWGVAPSAIQTLFTDNQGAPDPNSPQMGYRIGGPGEFDVAADSISLGNSYGILSCGVNDAQGGFARYNNLVSITPSGATVNVTTTGDLDMQTSTIAAIGGGNVNVLSTGGSMDLGSESLFNTSRQVGFGVFTSGRGDVNVTALGDVDIDGSRIATYNGGNIFVESLQGDVEVGSGGDTYTGVGVSFVNPSTGAPGFYTEKVFGSGIVANTLVSPSLVPGSANMPGNITVETPRGDITASLGGIIQESLGQNTPSGPVITLTAGTIGAPGYDGNIDLGQFGVIGGTVNASANGNITGLFISRQSSTITAAQSFTGVVLAGGSASVSGGDSVGGTIIGVGGADVSGGSVTADVLSQSANVNGEGSKSTLGSSAAATSTSQSAAGQSNTQANQQLANNDNPDDDKKKKKSQPIIKRTKRVTVL